MSEKTPHPIPAEPSLEDVLAQYIAGEETGGVFSQQEFLRQHPQHAADLREFFANRDQMQRLAEPLRSNATPHRPNVPLSKIRYFGDYELLEEVAVGGMGIVYKARQVSLNRIVAVKMILKGTLASEADVKRFQTEAEAAASLQHPTIVAIHEVGLHEGQHYFSMDFVEGHSLAELPREQPLSARQAAEYIRDAAEAVHYAHQQGTLHRDLKPSNILVDRQGRVRITDFGLAKRIEGNSDLTLTGQILGTPSYMPPEQARGKHSLVAATSDIYSLGAVLYELLAGRPPFRGESPVETLRQVESQEPLTPRLFNPTVPCDLETICLKCLEKEPHKRYGTAQLLAADLSRHLAGEPILARPISRPARLWRWCARHQSTATALAVSALLFLGITIGAPIAILRLNSAREAAENSAQQATNAEVRLSKQLKLTEEKEQQRTDELYNSLLAQARAGRYSREAGQRFEGLEALTKAATIRPTVELRNAAIACMALPDVRLAKARPTAEAVGAWAHVTTIAKDGAVLLSRFDQSGEVARLADLRGPAAEFRISPTGDYVAVRYVQNKASCWVVWDWHAAMPLVNSSPMIKSSTLGDWDPSGRFFFYTTDDTLLVWDLTCTDQVHSLPIIIGKEGGLTVPLADSKPLIVPARPANANGKKPWVIALAPSGRHLAIGSDEGVTVVDLPGRRSVSRWTCPPPVTNLAWSHDGKLLAAGAGQNVNQGTFVNHFPTSGPPWQIKNLYAQHQLYFTKRGTLLVAEGNTFEIQLADPISGALLVAAPGSFNGPPLDDRWLPRALFSPLGFCEILTAEECRRFNCGTNLNGNPVDFSPNGEVLGQLNNGTLRILQVGSMASLAEAELGKDSGECSVMFHPNGESLLTLNSSQGLVRWPFIPPPSGAPLAKLPLLGPPQQLIKPSAPNNWGAIGRDGKVAITDRPHNRIIVLDPEQPAAHTVLGPHQNVASVSLSPNGRWVASGHWVGSEIKVWDLTTGNAVHSFPTRGDRGAYAVFSPEGRWLATSHEGSYKLWQAGSWTLEREFVRKNRTWAGIPAFSPDGALLALPDDSRQIRIVNSTTGAELATLPLPHLDQQPGIHATRFSADGSGLYVSGHLDFFWDLRRIRTRLAEMGLDWEMPAYAPAFQASTPPELALVVADPLQRDDAPPTMARAEKLVRTGDLQQAVVEYDKILAMHPSDAQARKNRGDVKACLTLWSEAEDDYGFYLARNPDDVLAQMRLGILLAYRERKEPYHLHCETLLARLEKQNALDAVTCFRTLKACCFLPSGLDSYARLEPFAARALAGNPTNPGYWLAAGMAAHRAGNNSEALLRLNKGLTLAVSRNDWIAQPTILMMLCLVQQQSNDPAAAKQSFDEAEAIANGWLWLHREETTWWHDWLSYEILRREATRNAAALSPLPHP